MSGPANSDENVSPAGEPHMGLIDRQIQKALDAREARSHRGGGDGDGTNTNDRLTRLETHFEYIRRDLGEIRSGMTRLNELPTKNDLNNWKWQGGAMALAVIVLAVTGIVGGLALINRSVEPPSTQPIIVQMPNVQPSHGAANTR